jgi:hypothetical protein
LYRLADQYQPHPEKAAGLTQGGKAAAVAAVSPEPPGLPAELVRLRRGNEARWVDPVAESARYEQLLAEGFTA